MKFSHIPCIFLIGAVLSSACTPISPEGNGNASVPEPQPQPSGVISVNSAQSLADAAFKVRPGDTILMKDGAYKDVRLIVHRSGTADKPIVIKAEKPGRVLFSGDVRVELRGDHIELSGVYFAEGNRNQKDWKPHGPGLVAMYGSHCTFSECLFYNFDKVNSAYVTTSLTSDGKVPTHCRIHHCAFIGKTTLDQVINLNNKESQDESVKGPAMYHRVDHCYFSNPRKEGNAGGGIRVGYTRQDMGRCLIDHNLFERQDSEPEIVTSKSQENVYFANTCLNCNGTLNFRHGDRQVAIQNHFISTDRKWGYGGMFIWGHHHIVGANYFSLMNTIANRGGACIFYNPGPADSDHAQATDVLTINNQFIHNAGYAFCMAPLYEQRCETYGKDNVLLPDELKFVNNIIIAQPARELINSDPFGKAGGYIWKDNRYAGFTAPANKGIPGLVETDFSKTVFSQTAAYNKTYTSSTMSREDVLALLPFDKIEGIDLDFAALIAEGVTGKPLKRYDVGPTWCKKYPSDYPDTGIWNE